MSEAYPIAVTRGAASYLSEALRNDAPRSPDGATPAPRLLLKVGIALTRLLDVKDAAPLDEVVLLVSLDELWMLRDAVHIGQVVGAEPVGRNLLVQVYRGLEALTPSDLVASLGILAEGRVNEQGRSEVVAKLARTPGGDYAQRDTDKPDDDPNAYSEY